MGFPLVPPKMQFFDSNGNPLAGGKLLTKEVGGGADKATYSDALLASENTNPVILNARGEASVYAAAGASFWLRLTDASDVTIWTADNQTLPGTVTDVGTTLYPRTAAEIAAGVTPTNYLYAPGDVRRYGADPTASAADNVTAIQAALDANGTIELWENYPVNAALSMNDYNFINGRGRNSGLTASHAGAVLKGKSVTTYATTNVRRYSGGGRDFKITGPGVGVAGSLALDMRGCTMFKWWGLLVSGVETGVKQGDGYATFYNEYHGCDLNGVGTGYNNTTLGNENKVFGGRVNDCVTGTIDDDNSCNTYIGLAIEAFTTTGHSVSPTAASLLTRYVGSRLENTPTVGAGILVGATAQDTLIESPYFTGLTTDINDGGVRTSILLPRGAGTLPHLKFNGGTGISKILKVAVVHDVASLASATFRQEGPITVTGATVGDAVTVTLPAAWPNNIIVGVPIISATDTVYLPIYNPSGGAVDPASGTFVFNVMKFT